MINLVKVLKEISKEVDINIDFQRCKIDAATEGLSLSISFDDLRSIEIRNGKLIKIVSEEEAVKSKPIEPAKEKLKEELNTTFFVEDNEPIEKELKAEEDIESAKEEPEFDPDSVVFYRSPEELNMVELLDHIEK